MLKLLKRALLLFQIYELDITIKGQTSCLGMVSCPIYKTRIELARSVARTERTRLRGLYNATLPVGRRVFWNMA